MRYAKGFSLRRMFVSAVSLAVAATVLFGSPVTADAITRNQVLKRGKAWVDKKVPYSQKRHHKGYRQDCSGFVSMAWKLNTSYTTRSIGAKARRIGNKSLRAGDAVLYRGHIVLFVKWKNKKQGTFWAYEEPSSGKTARKAVRKLRGGKAYRLKGIKDDPKPKPAPKPAPQPAPSPVTTPSVEPTVPPTTPLASNESVTLASSLG